MRSLENYLEVAKRKEPIFRLILNSLGVENHDMSIEQLYTKYSTGNRRGIWTILSFREVGENLYEFSWEDIAPLSGRGSTDEYSLEPYGKLKRIRNVAWWRA
jgi:hypothetical protein